LLCGWFGVKYVDVEEVKKLKEIQEEKRIDKDDDI